MNVTAIEDALYTLIYGIVTPTVVSWDNQNAPRPDGGFISMRHDGLRPLGFSGHKSSPTGAQNTVYISRDTEFTLFVVGYNAAIDEVYAIADALELPATRRSFYAAGIAFLDHEPVYDLPGDVNSQIEPRRGIDLRLRVANRQSYSSDIIETVNVGLKLKRGAQTVVDRNIPISSP